MDLTNIGIKELLKEQVENSRDRYGSKEMNFKKRTNFLDVSVVV